MSTSNYKGAKGPNQLAAIQYLTDHDMFRHLSDDAMSYMLNDGPPDELFGEILAQLQSGVVMTPIEAQAWHDHACKVSGYQRPSERN